MTTKPEIIHLYKSNRKIIGYIVKYANNHYEFHTGKPSDGSCFSWKYSNLTDAMKTGDEFFRNHTDLTSVLYH